MFISIKQTFNCSRDAVTPRHRALIYRRPTGAKCGSGFAIAVHQLTLDHMGQYFEQPKKALVYQDYWTEQLSMRCNICCRLQLKFTDSGAPRDTNVGIIS